LLFVTATTKVQWIAQLAGFHNNVEPRVRIASRYAFAAPTLFHLNAGDSTATRQPLILRSTRQPGTGRHG
jgi:hypothetical protein